MSLLSVLPFSLPTERSTKEIRTEDGKLEAQGDGEGGRQEDRLVGRSAKQSGRESVVSHPPPFHLELQHDQQVPVALPCGPPLETTID